MVETPAASATCLMVTFLFKPMPRIPVPVLVIDTVIDISLPQQALFVKLAAVLEVLDTGSSHDRMRMVPLSITGPPCLSHTSERDS